MGYEDRARQQVSRSCRALHISGVPVHACNLWVCSMIARGNGSTVQQCRTGISNITPSAGTKFSRSYAEPEPVAKRRSDTSVRNVAKISSDKDWS
eukprot:SAG31_NODE_5505_length_2496_cov_2.588652_2_plen_95_part_00